MDDALTMDEDSRDRWSALAHENRVFCSPVDLLRFRALVGVLPLPPSPYCVDLGCGKGAALREVIHLCGGSGTGVDRSPRMLQGAGRRAGGIDFIQTDARNWKPDRAPDLAMCIGSTHIFGGSAGAAAAMAAIIQPSGCVVVGDLYWRSTPDAADIAAFGMSEDELLSLAGLVSTVQQAGFTPIAVQPSSDTEWDDYEWSLRRSVELWARDNPTEPDREPFLTRSRHMRDTYLSWRREAFGFALIAATRDEP
jgi:SAM-dependent methyltransferase